MDHLTYIIAAYGLAWRRWSHCSRRGCAASACASIRGMAGARGARLAGQVRSPDADSPPMTRKRRRL